MKKLIIALLLCAPMTMFAQKFGHIDTQTFLGTIPEYIAGQNALQAKAKEYDTQLQEMQKELQTKGEEYEKNASTMNQTKKDETEKSLQDMYAKIQQAYQDNQKALQEEQQKTLGPIVEKVRTAIQNVAKAGNYVYIMEKEAGQPIFVNDAISKDVTSEVKAAYDKLK